MKKEKKKKKEGDKRIDATCPLSPGSISRPQVWPVKTHHQFLKKITRNRFTAGEAKKGKIGGGKKRKKRKRKGKGPRAAIESTTIFLPVIFSRRSKISWFSGPIKDGCAVKKGKN